MGSTQPKTSQTKSNASISPLSAHLIYQSFNPSHTHNFNPQAQAQIPTILHPHSLNTPQNTVNAIMRPNLSPPATLPPMTLPDPLPNSPSPSSNLNATQIAHQPIALPQQNLPIKNSPTNQQPTLQNKFKQLSPTKFQAKMAQDRCDENYRPNHICRIKQLRILLCQDDDNREESSVSEVEETPVVEDKAIELSQSLVASFDSQEP